MCRRGSFPPALFIAQQKYPPNEFPVTSFKHGRFARRVRNTDMSKKNKDPLWTPQYTMVLSLNIIAFLTHFILLVSVPLYIRAMGGSNAAAGLSTGLYSISALVLRPIIGQFLDNRGRLHLMRAGLLPFIAGVILSNFTDSITMQLAIRILEGVGFSIISTTGATIVSDLVPESRLAEGIGYNGVVVTLTNSIGPLIGLSIINGWGYDILFQALIPLSVLPLGASFLLKETGTPSAGRRKPFHWKHLFSVEKGAVPASSMMVFASVSYGAVITFLAAFGMDRGIENMRFFFLLFPCSVLLLRLLSGKLMDRYGYAPVVMPSLLLSSAALLIIFFAHSVAAFSVAAVLYGAGYGSLIPAFTALAVQNSPPNRRGAANATFYIALDMGIGGGSIALGYAANFAGASSSFLISSALMLASFFLFLLFNRKNGKNGYSK